MMYCSLSPLKCTMHLARREYHAYKKNQLELLPVHLRYVEILELNLIQAADIYGDELLPRTVHSAAVGLHCAYPAGEVVDGLFIELVVDELRFVAFSKPKLVERYEGKNQAFLMAMR